MRETAKVENVQAMYDAFSDERLRWLIGKGDVLVQKGELSEERLQSLIECTIRDEYIRSLIIDAIRNGLRTVTNIADATGLDSSLVLHNLFALMKWNKVEIAAQRGPEYLYVVAGEQ